MILTPSSTISLYAGVEIDNDEQLVFKTKANQTAYFTSKLVISETPCTMVRKTGRVRITANAATVATCNYLSFVNPNFDNKVIYARIIDYDFVNNGDNKGCTIDILYAIDYWQTWLFDVQFEDCYIEREHLSEADYLKSVANPYDPTILEFRTAENLPISKDIEKPYYTYGNSNANDGVFAAEAVCNDSGVTNDIGLLLIFSDVGLAALDGYPEQTPDYSSPSTLLWGYISSLVYVGQAQANNLNFYKLSTNVYNYLSTKNPAISITSQIAYGSEWNNQTLGTLIPGNSNRIQAPVNYVYVDSVNWSNQGYKDFNALLDWFTNNSCLDNIIGIYPVPKGIMMFSGTNYYRPIQVQMPTAASQNVENKKLDLYPYSYYRIITPNGDVKELRIEDFQDAQTGQQYCNFVLNLDITERPNLLVLPRNYKVSGANPSAGVVNANVSEGLIYSQFPTMPYSISAWDIQLATVSQSIIANNTIDYSYDIQQQALNGYREQLGLGGSIVEIIGNTVSALSGNVSSVGDIIAGGTNLMTSGAQHDINQARRQNEWKQTEDAYKTLSGETDTAVVNNLKYTKPAYASDQYHQINGDGITNFNMYSFIDVVILKVAMNPSILAKYDQYFKYFGYTSGRCGIPRAIQYTRGATQQTDLPHWTVINNKNTTYIKTVDAKVIHSMLPVANAIRGILNNGVRIVQGDPNT